MTFHFLQYLLFSLLESSPKKTHIQLQNILIFRANNCWFLKLKLTSSFQTRCMSTTEWHPNRYISFHHQTSKLESLEYVLSSVIIVDLWPLCKKKERCRELALYPCFRASAEEKTSFVPIVFLIKSPFFVAIKWSPC